MKEAHRKILKEAETHRELILETADFIWQHPELGYREVQTSAYLQRQFERLGYTVCPAEGITGFIAELETGRPGPVVAVMGELDAVMCATHPNADPQTHAVHACGHFIQVSAMLGVAAVLRRRALLDELSGTVRFIAVPAEETIDLAYRVDLIRQGKIRYVAGKIEFLHRGLFDGVDMAMMFHADTEPDKLFKLIDGCDGCFTKHMEYRGVAAHAGGAPHKGVNALYAANLGLSACNALRETFQERDYVRYHPIITSGGHAANVIPDKVTMDTYVRAATFEKMQETNRRVNRALAASAAAIGAHVRVQDQPGDLPFHSDVLLNRLCADVIADLFGENQIRYVGWDTQSSDVGDISSLMPTIQPLCAGASGNQHGEDYRVTDKEKCILNPARVLSCMVYDLLCGGAALAQRVKDAYVPLFADKRQYFAAIDAVCRDEELVEYQPDGSVILRV